MNTHDNTTSDSPSSDTASRDSVSGAREPGGPAVRPPVLSEPTYATAAALAGLARQVETTRRDLGRQADRTSAATAVATKAATVAGRRVDELAGIVTSLADVVAGIRPTTNESAPVSWLRPVPVGEGGRDPVHVATELAQWIVRVYSRYDDARPFPACWLWHPEIVEELTWLWQAWEQAYRGEGASVQAVGDWHDRQRPGVVRRITKYAGSCSIETHQTPPPPGAGRAPLVSAISVIADWMACDPTTTPPLPTAEQVSEAGAVQRSQRRSHR